VETCESLEELSLLTAVLCRAAAYNAGESSEGDQEGELMYRGQVSRIQRRLGGLLSKYLLLDDWNKRIKSKEGLNDQQRHQMMVYIHEIAANISSYCRNVLSNSSHDFTYCRVLFGPSLSEALSPHEIHSKASTVLDYTQNTNLAPPNLGLMVVQLKQASSKILDALDEHKRLSTRLDSLPDESTVSNTTYQNIPSSEGHHSESRQSLTASLERQTHIIHLLSSIIENCLYVVWKHLDFYLVSCVPLDQDTTLFQSHHQLSNKTGSAANQSSMRKLTESSFHTQKPGGVTKGQSFKSSGVSRDEIQQLKETTPRAINESVLAKLAEIEQCYSSKRTHYGYMSALSRRLKRLINIHCS